MCRTYGKVEVEHRKHLWLLDFVQSQNAKFFSPKMYQKILTLWRVHIWGLFVVWAPSSMKYLINFKRQTPSFFVGVFLAFCIMSYFSAFNIFEHSNVGFIFVCEEEKILHQTHFITLKNWLSVGVCQVRSDFSLQIRFIFWTHPWWK